MILTVIFTALGAAALGYAFGTLRSRRAAEDRLAQARAAEAAANARLEAERRHAAEAARTQAEALRGEFRAMAGELARTEGQTLRTEHLRSLEALLTPLGRDIESFREQFIKGHADMNRYVGDLMEQTAAMGREADRLARALHGDSKQQGNWGEMVLANLLSAAGLTAGRDFTVQAQTNDDEGRRLIPDVVVHLPGGRAVVVDSKVSLTAFTDYAAADDAEERRRLLREHVASVRRHVRELSLKNYDKVVKGHIGYVLMFIPGEAPYAAAVAAEPRLGTEAYAQRVILLNPGNLLMALQLAHNLWQSDRQSRSVGEIYASAEKLYKKFALFAQNFVQIGRGIGQLSDTYARAEKQLATGRGNIVAQLEGWKKKGLVPPAELPETLRRDEADETGDDTDES